MTSEQIINKLDDIFENKKARNFLNHLVRAYFPNNNVEKIFNKPKEGFNCVITNTKLSSVNQVIGDLKDEEIKDEFFKYLHIMLNSNAKMVDSVQKLIGDEELAIQGKNTNTFMSVKTYIVFYDWVLGKFMNGDKHICWLLKGVNRNDVITKTKNSNGNARGVGNKVDYNGRATYSLGDLSALQDLKNKLK